MHIRMIERRATREGESAAAFGADGADTIQRIVDCAGAFADADKVIAVYKELLV